MSVTTTIPLSRGAPSLDIVDIEGLSEAAARAFEKRPRRPDRGTGQPIGYRNRCGKLDRGVARAFDEKPRARDQWFAAGRRVLLRRVRQARDRPSSSTAELRPHAARPARPRRAAPSDPPRAYGIDTHEPKQAAGWARRGLRAILSGFQARLATRFRSRGARRLLRLAREDNLLIFEDDPYIKTRFPRRDAADDALDSTATRTRSCTRRRSRRRFARASASATSSAQAS